MWEDTSNRSFEVGMRVKMFLLNPYIAIQVRNIIDVKSRIANTKTKQTCASLLDDWEVDSNLDQAKTSKLQIPSKKRTEPWNS